MNKVKAAFTLIELLVVIAIIAILAAILFPVFAQAKMAAQKTVALSNAKQVGLSMEMYLNDNDDTLIKSYYGFLPAGVAGTPTYYYNWRFAVDNYLAKSKGLLADPTNQYKDPNYFTLSYQDLKTPANNVYTASNFATNNHIIGFANGTPNDPITPLGLTSVSQVNEPADTVLIAPNRTKYQDIKYYYGSTSVAGTWWCIVPKSSSSPSCPPTGQGPFHSVGKQSTWIWVDGHAKAMAYTRTLSDKDHWQANTTQADRDAVLKTLMDEYK